MISAGTENLKNSLGSQTEPSVFLLLLIKGVTMFSNVIVKGKNLRILEAKVALCKRCGLDLSIFLVSCVHIPDSPELLNGSCLLLHDLLEWRK